MASSILQDTQTLLSVFLPSAGSEVVDIPSKSQRIPPLCVPKLTQSFDSSFARGYSHHLDTFTGISQVDFLSFLDGFNLALSASPPTWIVDSDEEEGILTLPYRWTWATPKRRAGVKGKKQVVISRSITDHYLRTANERVFAPRGLIARVCTTSAATLLVRQGAPNGATLDLDLAVPPPRHQFIRDSTWTNRLAGFFGMPKSRWKVASSVKHPIQHNLPYAQLGRTELWLMIAPMDFDAMIQSYEILSSSDEVEIVAEELWKAQLAKEREEVDWQVYEQQAKKAY